MLAVAALAVFLGFAYAHISSLLFPLAVSVLVASLSTSRRSLEFGLLDGAVLLVLLYESFTFLVGRYCSNSVGAARIVLCAVLIYFFSRLVISTLRQCLLLSGLIGVGGVALACMTIGQFNYRVSVLNAHGFVELVAFRAQTMTPPAPWVPGEWFTLVLLTLSFAIAVPVSLGFSAYRRLATGAVAMPVCISAALFLSSSRAVFWALTVSILVLVVVAVAYRMIRIKAAPIAILSIVCVLGLVLATENAFYPGIARAYAMRHTSQARSAEGRLAIWLKSVDVLRHSPIWGVGSSNAPLFLAASADQEETTGFASRTFSLPLQILTEKGAVGAALYLAVLVLAGREAHRKLRNPKVSAQMRAMTCCMVAGIASVLFRELTYSSLLEHAVTAMLFALILAILSFEGLQQCH